MWHIVEPVPRDFAVTATALETERLAEPPVLVFHAVEGIDVPVVTNLFASRDRTAHAIGTTAVRLPGHWAEVSQSLIQPVVVVRGACQDVCLIGEEADATSLPLMAHFGQDAGRYITSGVVVAKDPDHGWGNLSYARMQLRESRAFGISLHSRGHLWDYQQRAEARGQPLEVAVVIGMHPAFLIGAASRVPIEVDEVDIVGALLGHPVELVPCRTVDLFVPADAEYVLEGVIEPNARVNEGPFGEYTGYATNRSTNNLFHLTAITHRASPYYLDVCPGASKDHLTLSGMQREADLLTRLRQSLPGIQSVHYPASGTHYHCYVAIDKKRPTDARHAALLVLGLDPYVKLVIVLDSDIDITNESEVLWALATRMQPREDTFIIDDMTCNILDPSSSGGSSSKLAIDATWPESREAVRLSLPEDAVALARQIAHARVARDAG